MEGIGRGRLFIGAMHGSAPTGVSDAEPQTGNGNGQGYYNELSLAMRAVSALR
ncbi:MAG TPA: hypothetical protein VJW95_07400 [Dissulfurispiraceae bacterium]|nr:hypothetical protein [Dissulfurispiraceae bacterium]